MSCISAEGDLWACAYADESHRNHIAVHTISPGECGEPDQIVMYLQQEVRILSLSTAIVFSRLIQAQVVGPAMESGNFAAVQNKIIVEHFAWVFII